MNSYIEYLKNPFIAGGLSGSLILVFIYIDSKMNDKEFEMDYYLKIFAIVCALVTFFVYLAKNNGGLIQKGGNTSDVHTVVKKLGVSDIYTNVPDF